MTKSVLKIRPHSRSFIMFLLDPASLTAISQLMLAVAALVAALRGRKPPDQ